MPVKIPPFLRDAHSSTVDRWSRLSHKVRRSIIFGLAGILISLVTNFVFWNIEYRATFKEGEVAELTIRAPSNFTVEEHRDNSHYHINVKRGQVLVRAGDLVSESQGKLLYNRGAQQFLPCVRAL